MSEAKKRNLYTVIVNWNKLCSHLYIMIKEEEDADLLYIADVIWEDRYLSQIKELHVMTALLFVRILSYSRCVGWWDDCPLSSI
jgi:hypothetical protein